MNCLLFFEWKLCLCCCTKRKKRKLTDADLKAELTEHFQREGHRSGFDEYFDEWRAGTKKNEWPLREDEEGTMATTGMSDLGPHFWWFIFNHNRADTYLAIFLSVVMGICDGLVPRALGDLTEGKYPEFRKNPRTPKEMTNEICIEFKTVIFH